MDCTLFIPHLLPPMAQAEGLWRTVDAPLLKVCLGRATMTHSAAGSTEEWLCGAFGIARQQDFPLAPILAAHDSLNVARGYWLCATPAHLETRRNALVLTDPSSLDIIPEESTAFTAILTQHLLYENVHLHAPRPGNWYLQCTGEPSMSTTSLGAAVGRDIRTLLPQGLHSPRWHRILTEVQMLLHAHPLNDAREARGRLPVNSVWLWGGGTVPPALPAPFDVVCSDDPTVRALAHHGGCRVEQMPGRVTPDTLHGTSHFFSFESPQAHLRQGDVQAWRNAVNIFNRDWFMPLLGALQSRRLHTLCVVSTDDRGTQQFVMHRYDEFKLWRKNKYLQ
jgi:hypothetical protein